MADNNARDVRQHRARQRAKGLRLCQLWLPDTRSPAFAAQVAHDVAVLVTPTPEEEELLDAFEGEAGEDWPE